MQADEAVRGPITAIPPPPPRRGRRNVVLVAIVALVVIAAAAVVLVVRAAPLATSSGVEAEDAAPGAGSAVIHDDAWNLHRSADEVHPWVNLRDDEGNVHRVRAH